MNTFSPPENSAAGQSNTTGPFVSPDSRSPNARTNAPLIVFRPARVPHAPTETVVTLVNAEQGVRMRVGDRFLLSLGERSWQVRVGDQALLQRSGQGQMPSSQGYFEALKAGKTKLFAMSDPPGRASGASSSLPTLYIEIPVSIIA